MRLDEDAPADWTVWVEGPAGRLAVATIPAGGRVAARRSVDGDPLIGRYDTVLVGADADAPALSGALAPGRARDLLLLLDHDPTRPGGGSALQSADAQILILREHVRFLVAARDEGNLANVRFHGEHMVNITRGRPLQDVDGNGDPSNPGDGLGLIGGDDAHLPRISALAGPSVAPAARELSALVALIAEQGERCGTAGTVDDGPPGHRGDRGRRRPPRRRLVAAANPGRALRRHRAGAPVSAAPWALDVASGYTDLLESVFTSAVAGKAWLATIAMALALVQVSTGARIYGRLAGVLPFEAGTAAGVHRWSGRLAVLVTLPIVFHCVTILGFQTTDARVAVHSVVGSFLYGVLAAKLLVIHDRRFPGWALPVAGGTLFAALTAMWLTSSWWYFTEVRFGF